MKRKSQAGAITVDLKRCLGCRSCELACAKAHAGFVDIVEAVLAEAPLVPRVNVVAASGHAVPVQCQQCEDAPCVVVCPSGALYREEATGRTVFEESKCIGCHSCALACPFGAIRWSEAAEAVVKCDLCEGIIEEGEEPLCVAACPTRARRLVQLGELIRRRRREAAERTVALYEEQS